MLHSLSGATFAIIGFMLQARLHRSRAEICENIPPRGANICTNQNESGKLGLRTVSPLLAALFAFSFAVTLGVMWEIFEFIMDSLRQMNMQRWMFMPIPDSGTWANAVELRGAGLIDTMKDLIVGTTSGLIAAVIGYCYLKRKIKKEQ